MLNIFALRSRESKLTTLKNKYNNYIKGQVVHYPPANKEWLNSIYAYNNNTTKLLPTADKVIINLINSYFNLYSCRLEKKTGLRSWLQLRSGSRSRSRSRSRLRLRSLLRLRRLILKKRRLWTNRILLSRAELKHSSDKVIITLYIYNREKNSYLKKIKKIATLGLLKVRRFKKKIIRIKFKGLKVIEKIRKKKNLLLKTLKWDNNNFKNYERNYYNFYIKKSFKKEILYMYFKQIIYFNKHKFSNTYILPLKSIIRKVYRKKVEFNLVTVKYLHLNSDILTNILAIKLRNKKNRLAKLYRKFKKAVKLPPVRRFLHLKDSKEDKLQTFNLESLLLDTFHSINGNCNTESLYAIKNMKYFSKTEKYSKDIKDFVLSSIKNKSINGIRIAASGRLSKRFTAARAMYKFKHLGSLQNIDSSYKGLSSVMLRGHFKSNMQYTKLNSKTRIGAFGLRGSISSI